MVATKVQLNQALDRLSQVSHQQSKAKTGDLRQEVSSICDYADHHGLPNPALAWILRMLLTPPGLDQASQNSLLKSFFPAEKLPNHLILVVIEALGVGKQKASSTTQTALVRWLILVFELIDFSILLQCYSILFNLLSVLYLRGHLCHLLAKITQRKHVQPWRVRYVQHIEESIATDANISKLADLYEYLVPGSFDKRKFKLPINFIHPDPSWTESLQRIINESTSSRLRPIFSTEDLKLGRPTPNNRISVAGGSLYQHSRDLGGLDDIVTKFGKIDISTLAESDIVTVAMQHYLDLSAQTSDQGLVHELLLQILDNQKTLLKGGDSLSLNALEYILAYTKHVKRLPATVIEFLGFYLPQWRAAIEFEQEDLILELLSYVPILPWQDLYKNLLQPLETAILDSTIQALTTLLDFYTRVLTHWTYLLLAHQPPTPQQIDTLLSLTSHTALLSLTTLTHTSPPPQPAISTILSHLSSQTSLITPPLSLPLSPPAPLFISTLLFASPSLSTISRTSSLLARFKAAFETPLQPNLDGTGNPRSQVEINTLNSALMDTCNLFLRSKAFSTADTHALGCQMPSSLVNDLSSYTSSLAPSLDLQVAFSLSFHSALATLSIAAFRQYEEEKDAEVTHTGPVGQKSLAVLGKEGGVKLNWREYRVLVLRWLEDMGVGGIGDLGRATMKGLMGAEKGKESDIGNVASV